MQQVKRCPNPDCPTPSRVYVNGHTKCASCEEPLVPGKVSIDDVAVELLESMEAMESEVQILVSKKTRVVTKPRVARE